MYNPKKDFMFLHGTYIYPSNTTGGHDAVVACIKHVETSETELQIIEDPKVECWISKPGLRTFEFKRECVRMDEVDTYMCANKDQFKVIGKALGLYHPNDFTLRKKVLESPFVFGADIDILSRVKLNYLEKSKEIAPTYTVGTLDIENDVTGTNEINVMAFCDGATRVIYCGIAKHWLNQQPEEALKLLEEEKKDKFKEFYDQCNEATQKVLDKRPFTIEFKICDNEKETIIWVMRKLVLSKIDFCGVWNLAYDIPYIMNRCEFRQIDIVELMRHPDVPKRYATFQWKEDRKKTDHFTDVWHQVEWTGYTKFYDPMCLYSRLRKVKGRDLFYTLDYIGNKHLGAGKASFGTHATHADMQTKAFIPYCVYNAVDTIIPTLLDESLQDIASLVGLSGCSLLMYFAKQTVQLKVQFFEYCRLNGLIPGAVGGSMETPYCKFIGNVGGAVLSPSRMKTKGVSCLVESDEETFIYQLVSDLDVSSFYPSVTIAFNISRETKLATFLWAPFCPYTMEEIAQEYDEIKDQRNRPKVKANAEAIVNFFGRYTTAKENAVALCKEYFGMPGYNEMLELWNKENQ